MHGRRKWQPAPVFLPGESQGRGSLVGCRLWGRTESDTTEVTQQQQQQHTHIYIWVNTFGFYKVHSLAYFCFSSRGHHMHSKYLFIPTYTSEKAMAPHSSTLAWKIPWTEEPGGLKSVGSLRVGHDWATSLSLFTFMHWRRKWQPAPVFLPGES